MPVIQTRRPRPAAALGTAAALIVLAVFVPAATSAPRQEAAPRDALTLVRQALAALEVTPPDVGVAAERVLKALFAEDTREVDMPRLRDAQQALGNDDPAAAAAYLMQALRPTENDPGGIDKTLLVPAPEYFVPTPAAYGLLAAAALLMVAGGLIMRA